MATLILALPLQADVYIWKTFGEPEVIGNALVMTSPDNERLICVGREGAKRWDIHVRELIASGALDDRSLYLQDGKSVYRVALATGRKSLLARMPAHEALVFDRRTESAWSVSTDFEKRNFVFRDPKTFAPLWRDDRVESLEDVLPDRVLVVTTQRRYEDDGSTYTTSNAALRALDRRSGRELWAHPLHDPQSMSVRVAIDGGKFLIVADGIADVRMVVIDIDSGATVKEAELGRIFDLQTTPDGVLALATNPDRLVALAIPSLQPAEVMPLAARENLFFIRSDSIILTSGIYSLAAFDIATKTKLWEIEQQRLLSHPDGESIYASYSDRERDRAVVERIDLRTGRETALYDEPLPPDKPPSAAEQRESNRRKRKKEASDTRRKREEEAKQPPIGDELCFRFDGSGLLDVREYLHLRPDGVVEYLDANTNLPPIRMKGHWRRTAPAVYELRETGLVRDVATGRLYLLVGVKANVPLLADVRDLLQAFLQTHARWTFTENDIREIRAKAAGCPADAAGYCDVEGNRSIGISVRPTYPETPIPREELEALVPAIDAYLASPDQDVLRFRIETYRSYRFAMWLDPHTYWKSDADMIHRDIDAVLDSHFERQPAAFRLAPCGDLPP